MRNNDTVAKTPSGSKKDLIERLGNEMVIYLDTGGQRIIFKEDAHYKTETDAKMEIMVDLDRLHIFDTKDELNITLGNGELPDHE